MRRHLKFNAVERVSSVSRALLIVILASCTLAPSGVSAYIYLPSGPIISENPVRQEWWGGRFTNRTGQNANDFHLRLYGFNGTPTSISPGGGVYTNSPPSINWTFPNQGPGSTFDVEFELDLPGFQVYDPNAPVIDQAICANWTQDGSPIGNGNAGTIETHWYTGPIDPPYPPFGPIGPTRIRNLLRYSPLCPSIHDGSDAGSVFAQTFLLQESDMDTEWSGLDFSENSMLRSDPALQVGSVFLMEPDVDYLPDTSQFELLSTDENAPDGFLMFVDLYTNNNGVQGELLATIGNAIQLTQTVPEPSTGWLVVSTLLVILRYRRNG